MVKDCDAVERHKQSIAALLERLPNIMVLSRDNTNVDGKCQFITAKLSESQSLLVTAITLGAIFNQMLAVLVFFAVLGLPAWLKLGWNTWKQEA